MTCSLQSMLRLMSLLVVGLTILAVSVSRLDPPRQLIRLPRPATNVNINDFLLDVADRDLRWMDSDTGAIKVVSVEGAGILEAASCSPWVDDSGKRQMVGRWSSRQDQGPRAISTAFGLGRYSYPDGVVLDQIPCDIVPVSPPCWYPGTQARILFAGGDGQLHQFAFEKDNSLKIRSELDLTTDSEPTNVIWDCPRPGSGDVFIGDVSGPTDPRLAGRLLVSMRLQERQKSGELQFTRAKLWWLKLDAAGNKIVAAGPLIDHDQQTDRTENYDERCPVLGTLADGSLALAYARQPDDHQGWSVFLGRTEINDRGDLIPTRKSQTRQLDVLSQPVSPVFSGDGRWLSVLVGRQETDDSVARRPTDIHTAELFQTPANLASGSVNQGR